MNDEKKVPMPKGQNTLKILAQALYEHTGRTFGVMGDWVSAMASANFCTGRMDPLVSMLACMISVYIGTEWLNSEARKAVYYKQFHDSLGPHVGWDDIDKAAGQYNSWSKKIMVDGKVDGLGERKYILAHEYSHMLFDLLPESDRKAIINDFVASPDYPEMKEAFGKFAASPKDIYIIDEMMAIHGAARYDRDLKRRMAKSVIEKINEKNINHPIIRDIVVPLIKSKIEQAYSDHPLYTKYSLIRPIASKYDHLGFDKPITAAKTLRKQYMERLLATVA